MAVASKKSADGKAKASSAKADEPKSQDPSSSTKTTKEVKSSSSGRFLLVQLFLAVITGAAIGGYLAAYILETEYQNIVSTLQSDHQFSLLNAQNDYIKCQSNLSDEKQTNEEVMAKLRIHADQNERAFQQRAEQYLKETNMAYKVTNEGLEVASTRLKTEVSKHESTQLELAGANKRLQAIRNTLTELQRSVETCENELNASERQLDITEKQNEVISGKLNHLHRELDAAEEELDRRDIERMECDEHHRNMLACRESLQETLVELDDAKTTVPQPAADDDEECELKIKSETTKLGLEKDLLERERNVLERERDVYELKTKSMVEKISFRSRKEVLEQFGPGPHFVKITLAFPSSPENESILLELAPLDSMPHTLYTFLNMIQKKMYLKGTFILSREHILVGGPIDAHNDENNEQLEQRMLREGYFPHGALLFEEYTPDYPHTSYTVGFNSVGGPIFYINMQDNSELHGATGDNEGDPCFAKIVEGVDVIERISRIPKMADDSLESAVYIVDSRVVNITA